MFSVVVFERVLCQFKIFKIYIMHKSLGENLKIHIFVLKKMTCFALNATKET